VKSVTSETNLLALFHAVLLCLSNDSLSKTLEGEQSYINSALDSGGGG
jgi:hypothetical protein